jgi:hypothetical protein
MVKGLQSVYSSKKNLNNLSIKDILVFIILIFTELLLHFIPSFWHTFSYFPNFQ